MAKLIPITENHIPQIEEWIKADEWHKNDPTWSAEGLLTGNGALSFCLADDEGPTCFVILYDEGKMLRLSTQFAPEEIVSKRRLVTALLSTGIPGIIQFGKDKDYKGIVYESENESLINFMSKQGFKPVGGLDYALIFENPRLITDERG